MSQTFTARIASRRASQTVDVTVGADLYSIIYDQTSLIAVRWHGDEAEALARLNYGKDTASASLYGQNVPVRARFSAFCGLRVALDTATSVFLEDGTRKMGADGRPERDVVPSVVVDPFLDHLDKVIAGLGSKRTRA